MHDEGGDKQVAAEASTTTTTTTSAAAALKKSALQDNIERKGKNAYYFAHAHKSSGPKWDGKEQPKLLSKTKADFGDSQPHAGHLRRQHSTFDYTKSNITTYAFIDEPNKVKIYIENLQGVGLQCSDDDITLDYTPTSLSLVIQNYRTPGTATMPVSVTSSSTSETEGEGEAADTAADADSAATTTTTPTTATTLPPKCLAFSKLTGRITKAVYKKKEDRIILILTKEEEGEWRTINCKGEIAAASTSTTKTKARHHEMVV
jgi:hypothetical protein